MKETRINTGVITTEIVTDTNFSWEMLIFVLQIKSSKKIQTLKTNRQIKLLIVLRVFILLPLNEIIPSLIFLKTAP